MTFSVKGRVDEDGNVLYSTHAFVGSKTPIELGICKREDLEAVAISAERKFSMTFPSDGDVHVELDE